MFTCFVNNKSATDVFTVDNDLFLSVDDKIFTLSIFSIGTDVVRILWGKGGYRDVLNVTWNNGKMILWKSKITFIAKTHIFS